MASGRGWRAGFTTRARCLIAGGVTATICGILFGTIDLVRAGSLVIAVPIVAGIIVNRSQVTIASRRATATSRSVVGQDVGVQLTITNRSMLPTGPLMLEDRLPEGLSGRARFGLDGLGRRESRTVAYRMPAMRRGRYQIGPLHVRLTDPFGLIDTTRSFTATSTVIITPTVDTLPDAHLPNSWDVGEHAGSHSIGNRGSDDASTREYRHGDDLRKIHWRSSARMGSLMVRHEERPWQGHTTLLLDLRAGAHESSTPPPGSPISDFRTVSSLEWAISCVATIGNQLYLSGRDVSLISSSSGGARIRFPGPAAFVDHLADARPSRSPDLGALAGSLRSAARDSTVVAVIGQLDESTVQVLSEAHPRGSGVPAFAILLDTHTWADPGRTWTQPAAQPESREVEMLRASGWWVVTAGSGDSIPATWLRLLANRAYVMGGASGWNANSAGGRR